MVGWYDPIQLGRTAVEVLLSTIFGRHADKRIMQALADPGELHEKRYYEVGHTTTGDFLVRLHFRRRGWFSIPHIRWRITLRGPN
jgi:hypothetical protein